MSASIFDKYPQFPVGTTLPTASPLLSHVYILPLSNGRIVARFPGGNDRTLLDATGGWHLAAEGQTYTALGEGDQIHGMPGAAIDLPTVPVDDCTIVIAEGVDVTNLDRTYGPGADALTVNVPGVGHRVVGGNINEAASVESTLSGQFLVFRWISATSTWIFRLETMPLANYTGVDANTALEMGLLYRQVETTAAARTHTIPVNTAIAPNTPFEFVNHSDQLVTLQPDAGSAAGTGRLIDASNGTERASIVLTPGDTYLGAGTVNGDLRGTVDSPSLSIAPVETVATLPDPTTLLVGTRTVVTNDPSAFNDGVWSVVGAAPGNFGTNWIKG